MSSEVSLRERKRRRARSAIVDAAFALFAERGFAEVTVSEIAERAEVGRVTFFRYFGDKQEVIFADEQELVNQLLTVRAAASGQAPGFREALKQAHGVVGQMCAVVTADPNRYVQYEQLLADNPELHDRSERKLLHLANALITLLRDQGMSTAEAALAAHVGLACYRAAKVTAGTDPALLKTAVDEAFDTVLR